MRRIADDSPAISVSMQSARSERHTTWALAAPTDALSALCGDDRGAGSASSPWMNIGPWQEEGARAGEAQGSCAGAPGGRANGGT